jgi:purine-binding chemotaxis protein CheW
MTEPAEEASGERAKLVCFYLRGQEYAAVIDEVKETMPLRPITRVFLTPPWLAGIINLRGDVVAVLDLAGLLGMSPTIVGDESRILIARVRGRTAGLLVDEMAELRVLDLRELQPPPATLSTEIAALLRGIATVDEGRPLQILDLGRLLDSEPLRAFRRGGGPR